MQFPVYVHLGPLALHPHWVFETLAYFLGARLYVWLKARTGAPISPDDQWTVLAAAVVGAAIGSKIVYWASDPWFMLDHWQDPIVLMGGKSIVGGLAGGLLAVELVKRRIRLRRSTGDAFAIPLAIGIGIGRIGCFLTGLDDHTHGLPAALPWAVDYGDGIPRHPAQLYEIAFVWLLALGLARAYSFDVRSVKKTCVHIVHPDAQRLIPFDTYNVFYRDDLERTRLAPLRAAQERVAAL